MTNSKHSNLTSFTYKITFIAWQQHQHFYNKVKDNDDAKVHYYFICVIIIQQSHFADKNRNSHWKFSLNWATIISSTLSLDTRKPRTQIKWIYRAWMYLLHVHHNCIMNFIVKVLNELSELHVWRANRKCKSNNIYSLNMFTTPSSLTKLRP